MAYAQPSSFEARQPSLLNMGRPESVLSNNASMLSSARGNFAGGPMTPSAQYAAQSPFSAGGIGAGFGGGRDGVHSQFAGVPPHPRSPQPSAPPAHQPSPIVPAAVQSPWGPPEPIGARRVAQFEAPHPKVSNVTLAEPLPPKPQQPSIHTQARAAPSEAPAAPAASTPGAGRKAQQQSPWFAATNGAVQEGWGEPPTTNSLTFSNLVQHNQQHEQAATVGAVPPASVPAPVPEALAPSAPAPAPAPEPAQAAPAQARRKSGAPTKAPVLEPAPATHETILDVESPATPGATKTPWLVQEDKKPKPSGVSLGFREIQELEAKQTQARKAADKERVARAAAVAAVAVAVSPAEEAAPVKTTWGLPTSQTTVRTTPTAAATAAAAAVAAAAAAPVWTNAAKPQSASKKTMKEIQEEEERRKKQAAKEKETAAAAARRAYADSTAKVKHLRSLSPVAC
jgi:PERQ amino acid-rich with GYF domain-containing protein